VLIDRLKSDPQLRRLCNWERKSAIPKEWAFSRAFAAFAESRLPERVHEALIHKSYAGEIVGHISRDSTAIEAQEWYGSGLHCTKKCLPLMKDRYCAILLEKNDGETSAMFSMQG
jgi:hypothetical protein